MMPRSPRPPFPRCLRAFVPLCHNPSKSSHAEEIIGVEKGEMSTAADAEERRGNGTKRRGIFGFHSSLPLRYSASEFTRRGGR